MRAKSLDACGLSRQMWVSHQMRAKPLDASCAKQTSWAEQSRYAKRGCRAQRDILMLQSSFIPLLYLYKKYNQNYYKIINFSIF